MDPQTPFEVNGAKDGAGSASQAKYNLRTKSIQNRIEVARRTTQPRHPKPKHKPAPLSKYRRKTANFRERCRMQEMNDAFKRLQSAVPDVFAEEKQEPVASLNSKATKINTLKLAVNYISALTQMLNAQPEATSQVNNENLRSVGKSKCHMGSVLGMGPADVSQHHDLTVKQCHEASPLPKVPHQVPSAMGEPAKVAPYKLVCDRAASSAIASVYDFSPGIESDVQSHLCTNVYSTIATDSSDSFDLDSFALTTNDGSNLLDDFSALIDDLHEDNFCLVDGLIE